MSGSICRFCGTAVYGVSSMCLGCYRARLKMCGYCMQHNRHGQPIPIWRQGQRLRDSCSHCNGGGWVFVDETSPAS